MFHVKHSNGQTDVVARRKSLLVMGVLAVIAIALGLTLAFTGLPGESTDSSGQTTASRTKEQKMESTRAASALSSDNAEGAGNTKDADKTQETTIGSTSKQAEDTTPIDYSETQYDEDVVLVTPAPGAGIEDVAASLGVDASQVVELPGGLLKVTLPEGVSVEDALETLQSSEVVEEAQPDFIYTIQEEGQEVQEEEPAMQEEEDTEIPPEDELVDSSEDDEPEVEDSFDSNEFDEVAEVAEDELPAAPEEEAGSIEETSAVEESPWQGASWEQTSESADDELDDSEITESSTVEDEQIGVTLEGYDSTGETPPMFVPNDKLRAYQWGLVTTHVMEAWKLVRDSKTSPVTVAIIDEGYDLSHEDLSANIARDASGALAVYNAANPNTPTNVDETLENGVAIDHGTHVAGIIAAETDNGIGIAGVSDNKKIVPIKIFDDEGVGKTSYITAAYAYILEHKDELNIRVVNMSVGVLRKTMGDYDTALIRSIESAYNAGIVTVEAAGNLTTPENGPVYCYPSDYEHVVSVINLTSSSNADGVARANNSNYNHPSETSKNISAPGTSIVSTVSGNSYGLKSGTSMAAPHVSAIFALIFSVNPGLSASEAIDIVYSSATDLGVEGFDEETGYGQVNACKAVKMALGETDDEEETTPVVDPSSSSSSGSSSSSSKPEGKTPGESDETTAKYQLGASRMPVGSKCFWKLSDCSLKVVSGKGVVYVGKNGRTVKALAPGKAKVAVVDATGRTLKERDITVYRLKGVHMLANVANEKLKLSVVGDSRKAGAKTVLRVTEKTKSAKLKFTYKKGFYQLVFTHSGNPLKIKASSKKQNAPAVQGKSLKLQTTQWKITVDSKNRLMFFNRVSGKALVAKGTRIVQRTPAFAASERWVLR